ncbi:MAG: pseudaminic acid synthase [Candidatus Aureabacteria bacterium]|nr:pseudaminic acid synthase [Candidatus Auribacterota bacterium]
MLKPTFIIAEISANHGQNYNTAIKLIKKAKESGANAVKFQAYTPDTMTINKNTKYFKIKHPRWGGQTLYQLYQKASTPWEWFKSLKKYSEELGLIFFSTAFDKTSVDFLESLHVPMHKIASFELGDLDLIEYIGKTKKPLIISTGMSTFEEVKAAVRTAKKAGARRITLLKCSSSYPADPQYMNLKTIRHMIQYFKLPVGLSDHTIGISSSIAAVSLGATVIEKHFTLSRKHKTPDSFFSMEPDEFRSLVNHIRVVEKSLGKVSYGITPEERKNLVFKRSLFVVRDMGKGETFTRENIKSIRPNHGLPPAEITNILGKCATKNIITGTPLNWKMVE